MRRLLPLVCFGTFMLAFVLGIAGCDAMADVKAFRDRAAEARDEISAEVELLEAAAGALPDGDPRAARASEALASARSREAAIKEALERLDVLLAEAEQPTDTLSGLAHGVSSLVPAPFQAPILLAAGLGVSLFRAGQLKRSAGSIAASFEEVMRRDPAFKDSVQKHADVLRSVQTGTARRIVDETVKQDRPLLKLPI